MAITINGSGTITGISAGGLPDGSITADDIASGAVTAAKLAAGAGGKILQVVSTPWQSAFSGSFTNTAWAELSTSIRASITLSSSTSKVLVLLHMGSVSANSNTLAFRLYRDSSEVTGASGTSSNNRPTAWVRAVKHPADSNHAWGLHASYLDSPGSSGTKTYQIYVRPEGTSGGTQVVYINQDEQSVNANNISEVITSSSLTLMEVAA